MQKTETSGGKKGSDLPALKKALSSYLANEPQKTFPNLVGALKSKGIIDPQGLITGATNKRKVAYLIKAFPFMGSRELCLLTESPKDFVENYVFVPCDGETSLVYYLRSEGILNRDFQVKPELQWGCDTTQLLGRFSDENDYSFLEKMPKDIIESDWKSFNERPTAFEELTEYMEFSGVYSRNNGGTARFLFFEILLISFCFLFLYSYNTYRIFVCREFRHLK